MTTYQFGAKFARDTENVPQVTSRMKEFLMYFYKCRIISPIALVLAVISFTPISGKEDDSPSATRIAFLRITVDSSGFRFVDAFIVDGTLKSRREESLQEEYYFELVGIDSTVLFKGEFENPLIKRYEYGDADHPGQILVKVVELPSAEIIIRVPVKPAMYRLNIYRNVPASARGNVQPERKLITGILVESIFHEADK